MFVLYSSMLFLSFVIRQTQIVGLLLADSGLVLYTYMKLRVKTKDTIAKAVKYLTLKLDWKLYVYRNSSCVVCFLLGWAWPKRTANYRKDQGSRKFALGRQRIFEQAWVGRFNARPLPESQQRSNQVHFWDKDIYVTYIHPNIGDTLMGNDLIFDSSFYSSSYLIGNLLNL